MQIFAQKFHTSMDCHDSNQMAKQPQLEMYTQMLMGFSAFAWRIHHLARQKWTTMRKSNEPSHRKVLNRLVIFSTIFRNLTESHSAPLVYQKHTKFPTLMPIYWKNANYCCTNIEYGLISFAVTEKQWSEWNDLISAKNEIFGQEWKWKLIYLEWICWPCFLFRSFRSESAKLDSKPTSWPRSRMESHITKTSREKRKLQSSSPSSRNHPASTQRMKRFQKSTAIYTLPIREKQHTGTHCKTGKSTRVDTYNAFNTWIKIAVFGTLSEFGVRIFDFGGGN